MEEKVEPIGKNYISLKYVEVIPLFYDVFDSLVVAINNLFYLIY